MDTIRYASNIAIFDTVRYIVPSLLITTMDWKLKILIFFLRLPVRWDDRSKTWFTTFCIKIRSPIGMLTAGKSQTRVESCNSRVSIETLDFARVRTFHWHDWSWIAGSGAKGGGQSPASPGSPSIDRHSRQWSARNVAKRPGEGATGGVRPGKHNGRSAVGRHRTIG